jgi:hypothetical protein
MEADMTKAKEKTEAEIDAERSAQMAVMPAAADLAKEPVPTTDEPPAPGELPGSRREKPPIMAGNRLAAIIPTSYEDAYRLATGFVAAGMAPDSYIVKRDAAGEISKDGKVDLKGTVARVALGIMKGMEVGLAPVTAISSIMIINNRTSVWGDAALALIQNAGKIEWFKDWSEGDWAKGKEGGYKHFFEVKRKDDPETTKREFGFVDAERAKLIGKSGPWSGGYGPRMCFNRARAWALRDKFSDVLSGLGIVEEERDIETLARRNKGPVDTSAFDVGLPGTAALEHKGDPVIDVTATVKEREAVHVK